MASLLSLGKYLSEHAPLPIAKLVPYIPFSIRFGSAYPKMREKISSFNELASQARRDWLLQRMKWIVQFAYEKVPFYTTHYNDRGFSPDMLVRWEDIQKIPLVTKADLQPVDIQLRSTASPGRLQINTGGTSGQPLTFYVDRQAFAREWAHMHTIWESTGYRRTDLKITFRGKHHGKRPVIFNPIHNELSVNAFVDKKLVADSLADHLAKRRIKYVHGYPSAIYDFLRFAEQIKHPVVSSLRQSVHTVLLGSEYPAPQYRDCIKERLEAHTLSWYGHSEMAILAGEMGEESVYHPMHTYGLCEAVPDQDGRFHLVGTSLHNTASPFIRYDSGDSIEPTLSDGLLSHFRIAEGRIGESILDRKGQSLSLTALIFGRHHPLFSWARFVQISQPKSGQAVIYITSDPGLRKTLEDAKSQFNYAGVDLEFSFILQPEPIRTSAGKTPLLLSQKLLDEQNR